MPNFANKDDREQQRPSDPPAPLTAAPDGDCRGGVARGRMALFAAIAISGAVVDLVSKEWIFRLLWPPDGRKLWVWEPYIALELSLNRGALFGMGQGHVWLFALLSFLAAGGILYWLFYRGEARDRWLCIALALVMGGIIGNLYDRLGLSYVPGAHPPQRIYAVRDWILFQYGDLRWPNFNVADSLLVCGAGMLLIQVFFRPDPTRKG